tara:strand:+ start:1941 stop:2282 length:342 start_codon:yes stop_codon:yes gene_type:complete
MPTGLKLDTDVRGMSAGLANRAEDRTPAVMLRYLQPAFDRARRLWPVKSGESRDLLYMADIRVENGEIVAELGNRAWYAYYIRRGKTARNLMIKASDQAADRIVSNLGDELVR